MDRSDAIKKSINDCVKAEAEMLFASVMKEAETLKDLNTALWEHGKVESLDNGLDNMLDRLVYMEFSEKLKTTMEAIERTAIKKMPPL